MAEKEITQQVLDRMASTKVVVENAPEVYMTGLQLVIANKVYPLPPIKVPNNFSVQIQSSPLNAANILIGPVGTQMTTLNARILRPGEWVSYHVKNASIFQAMGLAANLVLNISCEYGG